MLTESNAIQNSSAAVAEGAPRSAWRVTSVQVLPGFRLNVSFADGLKGTVDLSSLVLSPGAGAFAALSDPALFAQAKLGSGAVTWPGDLDLAPDAMHSAIREHGVWTL
jgi:hypothetical protein